jgi:hypothetical protein
MDIGCCYANNGAPTIRHVGGCPEVLPIVVTVEDISWHMNPNYNLTADGIRRGLIR